MLNWQRRPAEAAGVQGRFWPLHDTLFEHQDALNRDYLLRYAGDVGLDGDRFRRALDDHAFAGLGSARGPHERRARRHQRHADFLRRQRCPSSAPGTVGTT